MTKLEHVDCFFFFFKQKTAYEMRISDWSSDVCSSDLTALHPPGAGPRVRVLRRLQRRLEHIHRQPARPGRERRGPTVCRRGEDSQRAGADGTGASPTLKWSRQRF